MKSISPQEMLDNIEMLIPQDIKARIKLRRVTDTMGQGIIAVCKDDETTACLIGYSMSGYIIFSHESNIIEATFEYARARKVFIGHLIEQYQVTKH